jgi:hypothetical protein
MAQGWKRESYQCTIHPRWCTGGCWFTLAIVQNIQLPCQWVFCFQGGPYSKHKPPHSLKGASCKVPSLLNSKNA